MLKLRQLWSDINSSLWFVPTIMVASVSLLAYGLVVLEAGMSHEWLTKYPLLFGAGADGARGMLTAIAGSMITVAGLIFSLTLATLAQVSSQYTSRILRNFMGDRPNQLVLGCFVSVFVYCLIVLRTIRGGDEGRFIPALAVAGGLVLALVSIGVLIFFIHHIASSIQASNIVARTARETSGALLKIFPERLGHEAPPTQAADWDEATYHWHPVLARRSGYIQTIDNDALLAFAHKTNGMVRMEHGVGGFVAQEAPLVSVARYGNIAFTETPEELRQQLGAAFTFGDQRTLDQDVGFGFRQLVDIALKALSPGINDTTTGVMCVDQLGALLSLLAGRQLDEPLRADDSGQVRVVAISPSFATFTALSFDQIRTSATGNVAILLRQLTALQTVARRLTNHADQLTIRQQADLTRAQAERTLDDPYEMQQVNTRYLALKQLLDELREA